jgi:hypothetical protein
LDAAAAEAALLAESAAGDASDAPVRLVVLGLGGVPAASIRQQTYMSARFKNT